MPKLLIAALTVLAVAGGAAALAGGDEAPASIDGGGAPVPTAPATGAIETSVQGSPDAQLDADVWIGKPIVSADGVEVGVIESVQLDVKGKPMSVSTTLGGLFGIGGSDVRLPVAGARFDGEELRMAMVETDIASFAAPVPEDGARLRSAGR